MSRQRLADGVNFVAVSTDPTDRNIPPEGRFLPIADSTDATAPLSVVEVAARAEISTFSGGERRAAYAAHSEYSVWTTHRGRFTRPAQGRANGPSWALGRNA